MTQAWLEQRERSNDAALKFLVWLALGLGRPAGRLLLYPVCVYFLLFSPASLAASKKYLRNALRREPGLADADAWGPLAHRERDRAEVDARVGEWTAKYDRAELLHHCDKAQVPCGPVYSIDEIFDDPQYAARGNILKMKDERVGELAIPNLVPRLSDTPGEVKWLGPSLGAHNA